MASSTAQVIDFHSYRSRRLATESTPSGEVKTEMVTPYIVWVPVMAYIPLFMTPWYHGR